VRVAFFLWELRFILHVFFWGTEASCLEMCGFYVDDLGLEFLGSIVTPFADMLTQRFGLLLVVICGALVWFFVFFDAGVGFWNLLFLSTSVSGERSCRLSSELLMIFRF